MAVRVIEWQFPKMLSYIMHCSCREPVLHNNLSKRSTSDGQPGCFFDFYFFGGSMEIVYGIISYKRAERQTTLDYLVKNGVPRERIVLSLNAESDIEPYQKYADRAQIIYGEAHNAAGNRNNILNYLPDGTHLILLDDDVKKFAYYDPIGEHGTFQEGFEIAEKEFSRAFEILEKTGRNVFGVNQTQNAVFCKGTLEKYGKYCLNGLIGAGLFGIVVGKDRFNDRMPVWDDFDMMLKQIKTRGLLKVNTVANIVRTFYTAKGGCQEAYAAGGKEKALRMLLMKYGDIATPSKGNGENGVQLKHGITRGLYTCRQK